MKKSLRQSYSKWAKATADFSGSSTVFITAMSVVIVWAICGPFFDFSEGWQLVINTGTTIITFLMIFLIQNTQNRDTEAIQVKLEELIRVTSKARNQLIDMEEKDEEEIRQIRKDILHSVINGCEPDDRLVNPK
jgi:low affinity Fe/Cu permease